jgi:DNA-binding NarL/FixJ family response regulator
MKRLFIVGSDSFIVHAMRFALEFAPDANVFGVIHGQGRVGEAIRQARPDVVIVDGVHRLQPHAQQLPEIREQAPGAMIVLLSGPLGEASLRAALDAGALVCMSASLPVAEVETPAETATPRAVVAAIARQPIYAVANGAARPEPRENASLPVAEPCPLTARELEILRAVAEGHTNARIGRLLWVTEQTVKFHLSNIYRKLGVSNRTEASRYALMNGMVTLPPRETADMSHTSVAGPWSSNPPDGVPMTGLKTA